MKVGINEATELKEESLRRNVDFAELLMAYLSEDVIDRVSSWRYSDKLWLAHNSNGRIEYYYVCDKVPLTAGIVEEIVGQLGRSNDIDWSWNISEEDSVFYGELVGEYRGMRVPVALRMSQLKDKGVSPKRIEIERILLPGKKLNCLCYSSESKMGEYVYEILNKLELIGDMKPYYEVNRILKEQTVSGRHIMEELENYIGENSRMLKAKRIEQLESYKNYSYMKKRWMQYAKKNGSKESLEEGWEEVMDRILRFMKPIWKAMCQNEIFFDDWMPELGRFLG